MKIRFQEDGSYIRNVSYNPPISMQQTQYSHYTTLLCLTHRLIAALVKADSTLDGKQAEGIRFYNRNTANVNRKYIAKPAWQGVYIVLQIIITESWFRRLSWGNRVH